MIAHQTLNARYVSRVFVLLLENLAPCFYHGVFGLRGKSFALRRQNFPSIRVIAQCFCDSTLGKPELGDSVLTCATCVLCSITGKSVGFRASRQGSRFGANKVCIC